MTVLRDKWERQIYALEIAVLALFVASLVATTLWLCQAIGWHWPTAAWMSCGGMLAMYFAKVLFISADCASTRRE